MAPRSSRARGALLRCSQPLGSPPLPAELLRREGVLACPADELACPRCGTPRVVIGCEIIEQLKVEPARYFVVVTKREKRACPRCPEGGVVLPPVRPPWEP